MRRTPTVPIASAGGSPPTLAIDAVPWRELEAALGTSISPDLRSELVHLTNEFLSWAVFERAAEPITGAEKRLAALAQSSGKFLETLSSRDAGHAARWADHLIEKHFQDHRFGPLGKIVQLRQVLSSFVDACRKATKGLPEQATWTPGDCWSSWIRRLTKALEKRGAPTSARKDSDKHGGKPSPFVLFIDRLQRTLPAKFARSTHSHVALAEAIAKARRSARVSKPKV